MYRCFGEGKRVVIEKSFSLLIKKMEYIDRVLGLAFFPSFSFFLLYIKSTMQ